MDLLANISIYIHGNQISLFFSYILPIVEKYLLLTIVGKNKRETYNKIEIESKGENDDKVGLADKRKSDEKIDRKDEESHGII